MAIEIKELIIRAIVESQSLQQQQSNQGPTSTDHKHEPFKYLVSLMKSLGNKNER